VLGFDGSEVLSPRGCRLPSEILLDSFLEILITYGLMR
jgi:hypothetical protein